MYLDYINEISEIIVNLKIDKGKYKCCYIHSKVTIDGVTTEAKSFSQINKTSYDDNKDFVKNIKLSYRKKWRKN